MIMEYPDYGPLRGDYPEYLAPSDDDIPVEDQPLPADASPATLSPGYVADSDPEEDSIDYVANVDDDEEEEEKSSEDDDDEEEEHLAPIDSNAIASLAVDPVPSAEETDPFETDESAATPPPPAYCTTSRMLLVLPTPPPSPLTPLSSPLPHIPSPPLPPTHTSPTYAEASLGYRAAEIWLRAASPLPLPAPSTSRRADIPEADIPPRKRLCLTAPTPRFEVGESSADAAARQSV
ncbi:hypothetical protein Tco_0911217 [Tanacetum coccineum]|uniref:Uncharacterized protein n=1 Tax=Tanacetum coccineum TaxID=301880 RepID=A0ABQ5CWL8_9ASTR